MSSSAVRVSNDQPWSKGLLHWAIGLLLVVLASGLALRFQSLLGTTGASMVYLVGVILSAYLLRFQAVIGTTLGSFLALNYYFVEPRYTFQVEHVESWSALMGFLGVTLVITSLNSRLQNQTRQAQRASQRAEVSRELAEQLAPSVLPADLFALSEHVIGRALYLPCAIVHVNLTQTRAAIAEMQPLPQGCDPLALRWSAHNHSAMGPGTGNWPELPHWFLPVEHQPTHSGSVPVLWVDLRQSLMSQEETRETLSFLKGLVQQISVALQRQKAQEHAQQAKHRADEISIKNSLLTSISHDFRTPLTTIMGAASTLMAQHETLEATQRAQLLQAIWEEASDMALSTENILSLVKLEELGEQGVSRDWESVEEIVGVVAARYHRRVTAHAHQGLQKMPALQTQVAPNLPLLRVDALLLTQALVNIMDNAVRVHQGQEPLLLQAFQEPVLADGRDPGEVKLTISDRGSGLSTALLKQVPEKFLRGRQGSGFGLGLAIVDAVMRAHQGRLLIKPRPGGGTEVTLVLPFTPPPQLRDTAKV